MMNRKQIVNILDKAAERAAMTGKYEATGKQCWYLAGLMEATGIPTIADGFVHGEVLTKKKASEMISDLIAHPDGSGGYAN